MKRSPTLPSCWFREPKLFTLWLGRDSDESPRNCRVTEQLIDQDDFIAWLGTALCQFGCRDDAQFVCWRFNGFRT